MAESSKSHFYRDGELWSFLRQVLSQGKDIHLDYAQRDYEQYSARLDVAALERLEDLKRLLALGPAVETGVKTGYMGDINGPGCDPDTG